MRYWAAPMLPVSVVLVGDVLGNGLVDGDAPVGGEHAAMSAMARTTIARRTDSDVRPRLPAVHRDACAVEKARLLRADERHHAGHLLHLSESPQRHLRAHERRDRLRVRLLPGTAGSRRTRRRSRTNAAIASGSACCRRCQPPPSHRIEPGATQLTVTPFDATSLASDLTKLISAALAALYAGAPPDSRPQTEEMTTTRPQPRVSMPGSTSCVMRALTTTLPANADSNSDGPVSAHELPARTPRLLMRMSTGP